MKKYKLCYVEDNFAYFTDNMETQWGDDWNDNPYEHNAGEPYEHDTKVKVVAFITNLETPSEIFYPNSPFSVEDINNGKAPWLQGFSYKLEEHIEIYAGIEMEEFCKKIIDIGGRIFLEKEEK